MKINQYGWQIITHGPNGINHNRRWTDNVLAGLNSALFIDFVCHNQVLFRTFKKQYTSYLYVYRDHDRILDVSITPQLSYFDVWNMFISDLDNYYNYFTNEDPDPDKLNTLNTIKNLPPIRI